MQGRVRQASVEGRPAGRRPERLRGVPQAARRARARGRARRQVRAQSRSGTVADVLHSVLVQGSVRHEGHAVDWRRRCALRHRLSRARSDAGRTAASQGRHHLREGQHDRIQRARWQSWRQELSDEGAAIDAGLSAKHVGRQSVQFVRHDARRLHRIELGLRSLRRLESRDVQPLRGDRRVVSRARQSQLGRIDPASQGDALLPRRRHRLQRLSGPHRHPLPEHHRLGQGARRLEGSGQRILRPS